MRAVKLRHPPNVLDGKTGRARKRRLEVTGHQLHDGFAPAQGLLPLNDPTSDVPVEQNKVAVHGSCSRDAGGDHPRFQIVDELPVFGRGHHGRVFYVFHSASPFSNTSNSFSSFRNP